MPLYEYCCQKCGESQEILYRTEKDLVCSHCGSTRLEKLLSVPAAPSMGTSRELPVCGPSSRPAMGGGCGLPQCGQGRCAGGM